MPEYKLKDFTSLSLQPGDKKEVEVEGIEDAKVLIVNTGGDIQAVGPKCTHYGAPLVKGVLSKGGRLTCPWHGGQYMQHIFEKPTIPKHQYELAANIFASDSML